MATTVIFAEIMIMGIITLTWLLILSLRLGLLPMNDLVNYLPMLKEWSTPVLILAAAVAYQLGSIMNTFSFGVMDYLWGNKIRNSIMSPYDCETASATVHQVGSSEIVKGVQAHITYSRLARSGLFNFFFLGVTLLCLGGSYRGVGGLFLLISAVSCVAWHTIYSLRYQEMRAAYEVIEKAGSIASPNS
jgi:hypothetical protein